MGYPTFDVLILIADYLLGVEKSKMLDVSTLNETQIDTVRRVMAEFNKSNRTLKKHYPYKIVLFSYYIVCF